VSARRLGLSGAAGSIAVTVAVLLLVVPGASAVLVGPLTPALPSQWSSPTSAPPAPSGGGVTPTVPTWGLINTSAGHPPPIYEAGMVYDPADHSVVLFGGYRVTHNGTVVPNTATWTFTGGAWTKISPRVHPSQRSYPAMTYDAADHYLLLFGGQSCGPRGLTCNDTWTFHAGQWKNVTHGVAPAPYFRGSMAWDAKDGYVVLFDGQASTWKWLHGSWKLLPTTVTPHLGIWADFAMAYDPRDKYVVLASSFNLTCTGTPPGSFCLHTWTFTGGNWTPQANDSAIRVTHFSFATDPMTREVVLFGGFNGCGSNPCENNVTWEFHSGHWTKVITSAAPPPRADAAMAYDGADGYLLLVGGYSNYSTYTYYVDSWAFA
jgi:hypothetical protein